MPLKLVRAVNYAGNYAYAPPQEEALIDTDSIKLVVPTEARGTGPFVRVIFKDGAELVCVGMPRDFLPTDSEEVR